MLNLKKRITDSLTLTVTKFKNFWVKILSWVNKYRQLNNN